MEHMLRFGHYSPTAPFSLRCEPYLHDYLVMHELPHVMVCGKARSFAGRRVRVGDSEVLVLAVP